MVDVPNNPELADAIRSTADRLGIDPVALGTAISYETAATFDPWKKGPTTQYGQHRGLIQWGEPQRQKYGVTQDMPVSAQMNAVERYLRDAGVKEGHGLLDVYAAINSGRVGRYNATDENNGGAPGTVADKVRSMGAHAIRARALLGEPIAPGGAQQRVASAPPVTAPVAAPSGTAAPFGLSPGTAAPAVDPAMDDQQFAQIMELMKRATAANEEESLPPALAPLRVGQMPAFGAARVRRRV